MFVIWFLVGSDIVLFTFTGPSAYLFGSVTAQQAQQAIAINGITAFGAWVGFFPVFINTITGMNELEERFEHLGTVLGATRWQMVKYFRFWRGLPNIASSMKSTVQLSIVGVIVAEFIASSQGIGYQIVLAWKNADLGYMFGRSRHHAGFLPFLPGRRVDVESRDTAWIGLIHRNVYDLQAFVTPER